MHSNAKTYNAKLNMEFFVLASNNVGAENKPNKMYLKNRLIAEQVKRSEKKQRNKTKALQRDSVIFVV